MEKTIQKREEYFLEFTEEELKKLNIQPRDKFTWEIKPDGSVFLKKHEKIEIDLEELSKDDLIKLCILSVEKELPINEVIEGAIKEMVDSGFLEEICKKEPKSRKPKK